MRNMLLRVRYYWHTDTEDVPLGEGWLDVLLHAGTLVMIQSPETTEAIWRVVQIYVQPADAGSMTWRAVVERGEHEQLCVYSVFVEPAEGPFHAGEVDIGA